MSLRLRLWLSVLMATAALAFAPILASAAQYDDTDPISTGCANTVQTIYSINADGGLLELRFSNGCYTAWAKFTCQTAGGCSIGMKVERSANSPAGFLRLTVTAPSIANGDTRYTQQLYDGGANRALACSQTISFWGDGPYHCTAYY
jgi:hypothetical protein